MTQTFVARFFSRRLGLGLAGVIAAYALGCNQPATVALGHLDVALGANRQLPCLDDAALLGSLKIQPLGGGATLATISGEELDAEAMIRRELPAGLYSVSWIGNAGAEGREEVDMVPRPALVSVFAGRVATLRLRKVTAECELATLRGS